MVAEIPQPLAEKYPQWAAQIPPDVLGGLTADQVAGRLRRAQARWEAAAGGDVALAKADATAILTEPAGTASEGNSGPSALKAAGVTASDMAKHGRWISRIPDEVLSKMDGPQVVKRAEVAAGEYARTASLEAADRILAAPPYVVASEPMSPASLAAYQRGVREDIARAHGPLIRLVPDAVLGKLDAAELLDRCEHAAALHRRGDTGSPDVIYGYYERARQVMEAQPRAAVEAEAVRMEKAAMVTDYPQLAQGYRAEAAELRDANPQAPAVPRPGVLGKAVRSTPAAAPTVLNKAVLATATAKPVRRRKGTFNKSEAERLGAGLDALTEALELMRDMGLDKCDSPAPAGVRDLLDTARRHLHP